MKLKMEYNSRQLLNKLIVNYLRLFFLKGKYTIGILVEL